MNIVEFKGYISWIDKRCLGGIAIVGALFGLSYLFYRSRCPKVENDPALVNSLKDRKIIVFTDLEPDDRKALDILAAYFDENNIVLVGTCVMNAARKKALTRKVLDQLGLSKVPVYEGLGSPENEMAKSTSAASSYANEGHHILDPDKLDELRVQVPCPSELNLELTKALERAEPNSIEVAVLAPPSDLVKVLIEFPLLKAKIKHIHVMGGWQEILQASGQHEKFTTYNVDIDPRASALLMEMTDLPMTLYSTHMLKRFFQGGSVNRNNFPVIIELIDKLKSRLPFLQDGSIALKSWNDHVMKTIPNLEAIIKPFADHQFTPADPIVAVGMINPRLILSTRYVRINIDWQNVSSRGCKVLVENDPNSMIRVVELIDVRIFREQILTAYNKLAERLG